MALMLSLAGCVDFAELGDSQRYKEDFHYTYPLQAGGSVTLENTNGSVEILGWGQDNVDITGTKYASTPALLNAVKITTYAASGSVRIRTERPLEQHGGAGARYVIHVPRKVLLDSIVTSNGGIQVRDVEGNARLKSSNGAVRVEKMHGDLDARTSNGGIETSELEGNARLHTSNGSIKALASHGSFEGETSNGGINVTLTDPTTDWPVRLHTSNGRVEATVRAAKMPDVKAETSNSSILLRLPENAGARLRAHTSSHSEVYTDFHLTSGSQTKGRLDGSVGSGGAMVDLASSNGSIKVLKF
jgi:DUF4097 and DUF4098 domain-containing protein YvlB